MPDEIEKSEPSPDDVLAAIQSFNDPSIIINIFKEIGWNYSIEIRETLIMAKQNANLSIKFKAIKHLRELLREAAETSGYTANVSQTFPNAQGGQTTFHAKRISNMLNPTKQIESTIKDPKDDKRLQDIESQSGCVKENRTESNRGSDRGQSQAEKSRPENEARTQHSDIRPESDPCPGTDTGRAFPAGDGDSGGTESPDRGETSRPIPRGAEANGEGMLTTNDTSDNTAGEGNTNPCIKTKPPTCDRKLFPGISSAEY